MRYVHVGYAYLLDNRDGVIECMYEATDDHFGVAKHKAMARAIKAANAKNQYEEESRFVPISHHMGEKLNIKCCWTPIKVP